MKKLLSILAVLGLTATTSASVVACGSATKKDNNNQPAGKGGSGDNTNNYNGSGDNGISVSKAEINKSRDEITLSGNNLDQINNNDLRLTASTRSNVPNEEKLTIEGTSTSTTLEIKLSEVLSADDTYTITVENGVSASFVIRMPAITSASWKGNDYRIITLEGANFDTKTPINKSSLTIRVRGDYSSSLDIRSANVDSENLVTITLEEAIKQAMYDTVIDISFVEEGVSLRTSLMVPADRMVDLSNVEPDSDDSTYDQFILRVNGPEEGHDYKDDLVIRGTNLPEGIQIRSASYHYDGEIHIILNESAQGSTNCSIAFEAKPGDKHFKGITKTYEVQAIKNVDISFDEAEFKYNSPNVIYLKGKNLNKINEEGKIRASMTSRGVDVDLSDVTNTSATLTLPYRASDYDIIEIYLVPNTGWTGDVSENVQYIPPIDNSHLTISKATVSYDGKAITFQTSDELIINAQITDFVLHGTDAKIESIGDGIQGSDFITLNLSKAVIKNAKVTIDAYASKDVAVDTSAIKLPFDIALTGATFKSATEIDLTGKNLDKAELEGYIDVEDTNGASDSNHGNPWHDIKSFKSSKDGNTATIILKDWVNEGTKVTIEIDANSNYTGYATLVKATFNWATFGNATYNNGVISIPMTNEAAWENLNEDDLKGKVSVSIDGGNITDDNPDVVVDGHNIIVTLSSSAKDAAASENISEILIDIQNPITSDTGWTDISIETPNINNGEKLKDEFYDANLDKIKKLV